MRSLRRAASSLVVLLASSAALTGPALALTSQVLVDSQSTPWNPEINVGYDYGSHDLLTPTSVSAGFDFTAGNLFTISYVSGLTSPYGATDPYADANGDTTFVANDNPGSSGSGFASKYMDFSSADIYLNQLVGTFADSSGVIVGTPFAIGNGPFQIAAPLGATQLLLGVNADIFAVEVSGSSLAAAVPEPATWAMMIGGLGLAGGSLRVRRRSIAFA